MAKTGKVLENKNLGAHSNSQLLFLNDKQPPSVFYTVDGFSMLSIKFLSK
jgi:hypothetical protein